MLFAIHCIDRADGAEIRTLTQPEHAAYMRDNASRILLGGPLLDSDGVTRRGMLVVLKCSDAKELNHFIESEPYHLAGLFAQVITSEFSLVIHNPLATKISTQRRQNVD